MTLRQWTDSRRFAWTAVLGLAVALLSLIFVNVNVFDEGISVSMGWAVAHGAWPYRDFWILYSPGQYFALGALFKLGLDPFFINRVFDVLIKLSLTTLIFLMSRRLGAGRWAWFSAGLAGLSLVVAGFFGYPVYAALLLSLFAIVAADRAREDRWAAFCGIALATTAFFRQDIGAYVGVVTIPVLLLAGRRSAAIAGLSALALSAVLWLPVFWHVDPKEVIDQIWTFPTSGFRKAHQLPLPPLLPSLGDLKDWNQAWSQFYLMPLFGLLSALFVRKLPALAWMLLAFAAFLMNQAINRNDGLHRLPYLLVLAPVFALVLKRQAKGMALILAAAIMVSYARAPLKRWAGLVRESMRLEWITPDARAAADYVRNRTLPDEAIFVANGRMDRILVNDMHFYALAQRRAGVKWTLPIPGITTNAESQLAMIRQMDAQGVKWIVRCTLFDDLVEANESSHVGSRLLDEWIEDHFVEAKVFGGYRILARRRAAVFEK